MSQVEDLKRSLQSSNVEILNYNESGENHEKVYVDIIIGFGKVLEINKLCWIKLIDRIQWLLLPNL